jgi:exopolysaccharide biosynthesis polyprenyl glycosylphosphotransferase
MFHPASTPVKPPSILLKPQTMQLVVDVVAFSFSFFAYQWIRGMLLGEVARGFSVRDNLTVWTLMTLYWVVVFWLGGLYKDFYVRSPFDEFFTVIRQTFIGSAVFFILIYMSSNTSYQSSPRMVFVLYWLLMSVLAIGGRFIARWMQRRLREGGMIRLPTVLVGQPDRLAALEKDLIKEIAWGYDVIGVITTEPPTAHERHMGPVIGRVKDLPEILDRLRPSEVLISMDHSDHAALLTIVSQGADAGCNVKIVPDMYEIISGQARTQQIYGAPLIDVNPELMQPWEEAAKRLLDLFVSVTVLTVGLPIWMMTALAVKMTSKGPVFFVQERVGRHGHTFKMAKFRSMYTNDRRGPTWTQSNDPRVTPIGRFLRKTHLDEIPQLWNVLRGEMSLVGPRPEQPFFVEKFTSMLPYYRRRHKVRPGITGWWQVKARSNPESREEIENRLRYDFFYIENMSFKLDLEIIVRTFFVMMRGHGRA